MRGHQLPLGVQLSEAATFDNFFRGPNEAAAHAAAEAARSPLRLFLYGPPGSGKSHLLHAAARTADEAGRRAAYLPLRTLGSQGVTVLDGLESAEFLALDDCDAVCADPEWAVVLLRLLDRRRSAERGIVLSATSAPERLQASPDLRTRLGACAVHGLQPMNDQQRELFLQQRARARGLDLSEEIGRYLLNRLPRDTPTLLAVLERLDQAALTAQRRLTLPFVQQTLRDLVAPEA